MRTLAIAIILILCALSGQATAVRDRISPLTILEQRVADLEKRVKELEKTALVMSPPVEPMNRDGNILYVEGWKPAPDTLKTLERHNSDSAAANTNKWMKTDIACPKCGKPLEKNLSFILTSYPAQYHTRCAKCAYTGTCF